MSMRDNFKVGDRVRPSRKGLRANLWWPGREPKVGTVTVKSRAALCVVAVWDGLKTSSRYHKDFISHAAAVCPTEPPGRPSKTAPSKP